MTSSELRTLRSTSWDGPSPGVGDLLTTRAGPWFVIVDVAAGAGLGHFTMRVQCCGRTRPVEADDTSRSIFRWRRSPLLSYDNG